MQTRRRRWNGFPLQFQTQSSRKANALDRLFDIGHHLPDGIAGINRLEPGKFLRASSNRVAQPV